MFIPMHKMKQLREAAKGGDERAKKILHAQLNGSDFSCDLDEFFAPKEEPVQEPVQEAEPNKSKLQIFLESNGVKEGDEDYNEFVEDFYNEFPEEKTNLGQKQEEVGQVDQVDQEEITEQDVQEEVDLTKDIAQGAIDLISKCDQTLMMVLQNDDIEDAVKKGIQTTLQEIKQTTLDNFEKIKKIKASLTKKEEKEAEKEVIQQENI